MLSRLYKLDHLYGLLLTFGLALIIQGVFRTTTAPPACPIACRRSSPARFNLGFMFLPKYRAWVIVASLLVCLSRGSSSSAPSSALLARGDRESGAGAGLRHQRAAHDHADLRLRRRAGGVRRRDGGADLPGQSADGRQPDHRRVRGGRDRRHGLDPGLDPHRLRPRRRRGPDQGVLSGSVEHRDLRHHGDRADDPARGPVRKER